MDTQLFLQQRLLCVAVIDRAEDAVPLTEALLAGGLNVIEVTFRTAAAATAITRICQALPNARVGAGTLLSSDQVKKAIDSGAQFGVSPGLSEAVLQTARDHRFPMFPGVITPTEVTQALELGWQHLKFFPSEAAGGVNMLKALAGPFGHTGVKFVPTGGITAANLPYYLALPHAGRGRLDHATQEGVAHLHTTTRDQGDQPDVLRLPHVAAVGGSWMAERTLVADKAWKKITALTEEAMHLIALAPKA